MNDLEDVGLNVHENDAHVPFDFKSRVQLSLRFISHEPWGAGLAVGSRLQRARSQTHAGYDRCDHAYAQLPDDFPRCGL